MTEYLVLQMILNEKYVAKDVTYFTASSKSLLSAVGSVDYHKVIYQETALLRRVYGREIRYLRGAPYKAEISTRYTSCYPSVERRNFELPNNV